MRSEGPEILEYIKALTHVWPVIPVRHDNRRREFLTSDRHITRLPIPDTGFRLHDKLSEWLDRNPHFQSISNAVKDPV